MALKPKTEEELVKMRESALMVSKAHAEVAKLIRPGITGKALDKVAYEFIMDNNATPSFLNYNGTFPASLCISVNDVVVHGIPDDVEYKDGDIVSIDCGVFFNGYHGDMAYTYAIGSVAADTLELMRITKQSLYEGVAKAITNNRVGDIASSIQNFCEQHGYGVVRELVGHGVGSKLHEEPQVPNYGRKGDGKKLLTNVTLAIEPMINLGTKDVYTREDNWTVATQDGAPSAHFEHTICVKPGKPEILTTFEFIEAAVRANKELTFV